MTPACVPVPPRRMARAPARELAARALLAAIFALTSCAPHRQAALPPLASGAREAVFREALARREALGRAVDAEVTLWGRSQNAGAWPGVTGALMLAAPDAVRLRVASWFGTAFDASARGDSVVAVLPARRLGLAVDATRDALGLRRPGAVGFRLFTATWHPPDSAWASQVGSEGALVLRWTEEGNSLRLGVGPDGLPGGLTLTRGDSVRIQVSYGGWMRHDGVAWPSSIELGDGDGAWTLRCRVERARFRARPRARRPVLRLPAGTEALEWPAFRRELERGREL